MTYAVLSAELFKLRKRPAVWVVAGLWILLGLMFGYLFPYLGSQGSGGGFGPDGGQSPAELLASTLPADLVPTLTSGLPMFGGAFALILGVLISGSEYGWGTVKTILAQGPSRTTVLAGKIVVAVGISLALVLTEFVTDSIAAWLVATVKSAPAHWPPVAELARGVGVGWLIVVTWCLGGLMLGTLLRGTALPVGLGLIWALVVENLIRGFASLLGFMDFIQKWLPGTNGGSAVAALGASTRGNPGVSDAVSGTHAGAVLVAYVALFCAVALIVFRRRDVT
jgi:ABC-type transport system involved in multi-copper enzyme maturation permease subunit